MLIMAPPARTEDSLAVPLSDLYTVSSGKNNRHYRRIKEKHDAKVALTRYEDRYRAISVTL